MDAEVAVENSGRKVERYLEEVSYKGDADYVPSTFALEFVNFIKLVNGTKGEENVTPVAHLKMLDQLADANAQNVCNLCCRGLAKSTLFGEYLFLYLAMYGELPGFGVVDYVIYVSDSIENGVKKMRFRIERRWENSKFLQKYVPEARFTDIRWKFKNLSGKELVVSGHGAKTGVRGTVELNTRPQLAVLDDLLSDEDARSPTVIKSIEDTVYKAIDYALHPTRNKIIWCGTPFNARDPLYRAVESGAWAVNVFPVCEAFPVPKKEFRSAWPDRFTYEYVKEKHDKAVRAGRPDTFDQELMLQIMSEDDRLIHDEDIVWYEWDRVRKRKGMFNFYITTDFATKDTITADYSVISVWAHNNNGDWLWCDGICARQDMGQNIEDLFRMVEEWRPQSVGIEISGQQGGFIPWIQNEMMSRNIYFTLASENSRNQPGIRPTTNKMQRFNVVVPLFKKRKVWFPHEARGLKPVDEAVEELTLASPSGFRSKHDDFIDTISMLGVMRAWKPSEITPPMDSGNPFWDDLMDDEGNLTQERYIV